MATPARTSAPERIGSYDVVGVLGRGAMSVVYDARDAKGASLALKVFVVASAADPSGNLAARFLREGEILTRLDIRGVVKLREAGRDGGNLFLALERVQGASLLAMRRQNPFDFEPLLELGVRLAKTLSDLHAAGVIHRDVKPANVLLDPTGYPVLADFGISGMDGATGITQTGELLGSPGFIAPEVLEGESASAASDQFALGRVLFELGARGRGARLPRGPILEVVRAAQHIEWERFPTESPWPDLKAVLQRMLSPKPAARFPSCDEVQSALTSIFPDVLSSDTLAEQVADSGLGIADPWTVATKSGDIPEADEETVGVDATTVSPVPAEFDEEDPTPAVQSVPLSLPIPGGANAYRAPVETESAPLVRPGSEPAPSHPIIRSESIPQSWLPDPPARDPHAERTAQLNRQVRELQRQVDKGGPRKWFLAAAVGAAALAVGLIVGTLAAPRTQTDPFVLMTPLNDASAPTADYLGEGKPSARDIQDARGALQTAREHLKSKNLPAAERHLKLCIELADLPRCHKTLAALYALALDPKSRVHLEQYLILQPRAPEAEAIKKVLNR